MTIRDDTNAVLDGEWDAIPVDAPTKPPASVVAMPVDEGEFSDRLGKFVTPDQAFDVYRSASHRSLRKTADVLGIPRGTILSWSTRYAWRSRLNEADLEMTQGVAEAVGVAVVAQQLRTIQTLVAIRDSDDAKIPDRLNAARQLTTMYDRTIDRALIAGMGVTEEDGIEEDRLMELVSTPEGARELLARLRERVS